MVYIKTNELYHHGIKGQKWGVRNGPPYPLKPGDHSAAEKKAGYESSNAGTKKKVNPEKIAMGILIGVGAAAATAVAAYTVYSLVNGNAAPKGRQKFQEIMDEIGNDSVSTPKSSHEPYKDLLKFRSKTPEEIKAYNDDIYDHTIISKYEDGLGGKNVRDLANELGVPLKTQDFGIDDDADAVNPDFDFTEPETSENCGYCSTAYILRRMGMDVTAVKNESGITVEAWNQMFKGSFDTPDTIFYNPSYETALQDLSDSLTPKKDKAGNWLPAMEEAPGKKTTRNIQTSEAFNLINRPGVRVESPANGSFEDNVYKSIKKHLGNDDQGIGVISVNSTHGGHVFNWEKLPGQPIRIIDSQAGLTDKDALRSWNVLWRLNNVASCHVGRIDNCRSVDTEMLKTFIPNTKDGHYDPKK